MPGGLTQLARRSSLPLTDAQAWAAEDRHASRCRTSGNGRSVSTHPDEKLLAELRQRQQTPTRRARLRERVKVEHALAHIGLGKGDDA